MKKITQEEIDSSLEIIITLSENFTMVAEESGDSTLMNAARTIANIAALTKDRASESPAMVLLVSDCLAATYVLAYYIITHEGVTDK